MAPAEGSPKPARRPKRSTRRSVLVADFIANWTITIGGLGVIVAVFGIMVFLAQVVWPLFAGSQVLQQGRATLQGASADVLMELSDEYRTIVVAVQRNGE